MGFIFYYKQSQVDIEFKPFFRTNSQEPKYIPPFPELADFDQGILKVCGEWGKS